jgi:glycosyltransferase involved in cell wall biosynthesis
LKIRARRLGIAGDCVHRLAQRSARLYADLDVLVVSSNNEGTPLSAIEAMATSCPVVATRVGGIPDIITDEVTGRLVWPGEAEGIASAVLDLLADPEKASRIGANAMIAARQRFDVKRLITDMDGLYRELLNEKAIRSGAVEQMEARVNNETVNI